MHSMRIRHPRGFPIDRSDGQPTLSVDSTHMHQNPSPTSDVQTSPQLFNSEDYIHPALNESNEELYSTYLKPDFLDPLVTNKCEPVCPSPLALLAKTCQNIGQMMEASMNNSKPITQQSTTMSQHSTSSGTSIFTQHSINSGNNSNHYAHHVLPVKALKSKVTNTIDVKPFPCSKKSLNGRLKWMRMDTNACHSVNCTTGQQSEGVSSTSYTASQEQLSVSGTRGNAVLTSNHSHAATPMVPNVCSAHSPACQSLDTAHTARITTSTAFTCQSNDNGNSHTTSNALAQLARLSSSLSLPEPSRTGCGSSEAKGNLSWNSPLRVQTGVKRLRHNSCTGTKNNVPSLNSPNIPRKLSRNAPPTAHPSPEDGSTGYPDVYYSTVSPITSHTSMSPQPVTSLPSTNQQTNGNAWLAILQFIQQMANYKEEQVCTVPPDTFSYNLARSFLDLFYNKLLNTSSVPPSTTHDYNQEIFNSSSPKNLSDSADNHVHNLPGPLSGFPRLPTKPESPQLVPQSSHLRNRCFVCGFQCTNQAELCLHVYSHLMSFDQEQTLNVNSQPTRQPIQHGRSEPQQTLPKGSYNAALLSSPLPAMSTCDNSQALKLPSPASRSTLNFYLANWIAKQRVMASVRPPIGFTQPEQTAVTEQPNTTHGLGACQDFSASKYFENSVYSYWMKVLSSYSTNGFATKPHISSPAHTMNPPCPVSVPSSNNTVVPYQTISPYNWINPHLTLFPKV
ncbi:uncharacterized protein DEA37_0008746 [Paragonimus westermani]|uniref:Uncharacterized protein n=1 Tax=Paragonimus westermani TaxID=34504 RepID=A0A5J4NCC9_9TREM|nr:uncharacterized protein DEA37_0008746 [Paragonimus westermani]